MPKTPPSFASLAAGVASRIGRLTIQAAQQASSGAAVVARKSLTQVSQLLDQAIDATKSDDAEDDAKAPKSKTNSKALTKATTKTRSSKPKRK